MRATDREPGSRERARSDPGWVSLKTPELWLLVTCRPSDGVRVRRDYLGAPAEGSRVTAGAVARDPDGASPDVAGGLDGALGAPLAVAFSAGGFAFVVTFV